LRNTIRRTEDRLPTCSKSQGEVYPHTVWVR